MSKLFIVSARKSLRAPARQEFARSSEHTIISQKGDTNTIFKMSASRSVAVVCLAFCCLIARIGTDESATPDTTTLHHMVNTANMSDGCELDLVSRALDAVAGKTPPMDESGLHSADGCGKTVYARAMCFNMEDPLEYQSKCSACMRKARETILANEGKHAGANLRLQDCYLRFEFYYFS